MVLSTATSVNGCATSSGQEGGSVRCHQRNADAHPVAVRLLEHTDLYWPIRSLNPLQTDGNFAGETALERSDDGPVHRPRQNLEHRVRLGDLGFGQPVESPELRQGLAHCAGGIDDRPSPPVLVEGGIAEHGVEVGEDDAGGHKPDSSAMHM